MMAYLQVFDGTGYRTILGVPGNPSYPAVDQGAVPRSAGDTLGGGTAVTDWDDDWQYPIMQNGWRHHDPNFAPAKFRRMFGGLVVMEGLVGLGTAGTVMFQLPPGYRPGQSLIIATYCNDKITRLQINQSGAVYCPYSAATNWHSIECSFFADDWEHA